MKKGLSLLFVSLAPVTIAVAQPSADETSPSPNVVLFIADDVSSDFSCFGGQVQTPNIDTRVRSEQCETLEEGIRLSFRSPRATFCQRIDVWLGVKR